jgi:hypothetical protein
MVPYANCGRLIATDESCTSLQSKVRYQADDAPQLYAMAKAMVSSPHAPQAQCAAMKRGVRLT